MQWTRKDTAYGLSTMLFLGSWAYSVYAMEERRHAETYSHLPEVTPELQQYADENGLQLVPGDREWILFGGQPELHHVDPSQDRVEHVQAIKITPEMTREELAEKLGMSPEDLPPDFRVDAGSDARDR